MKSLAIIPARYASTRFPGKPLVHINGKSMIRRVCELASEAFGAAASSAAASGAAAIAPTTMTAITGAASAHTKAIVGRSARLPVTAADNEDDEDAGSEDGHAERREKEELEEGFKIRLLEAYMENGLHLLSRYDREQKNRLNRVCRVMVEWCV
jgi:hypothetical protein